VEAATFGVAARAVSLGVMGLGIALIRDQAGSDEFEAICGVGKRQTWATLAVAVGGMSLAGLPGTVGFVSRWATARVLGQTDLEVLVLTLLAGASIGVGIIRGLMALFAPEDMVVVQNPHAAALAPRRIAFTVGLAVMLVIALGIAPGVVSPVTKAIVDNYTFYK
jgi:multicomponent Na+:H+ antiporter subunit D